MAPETTAAEVKMFSVADPSQVLGKGSCDCGAELQRWPGEDKRESWMNYRQD